MCASTAMTGDTELAEKLAGTQVTQVLVAPDSPSWNTSAVPDMIRNNSFEASPCSTT